MQVSSTPSQMVVLPGIILIILGIAGSYLLVLPRLQSANTARNEADAQLSTNMQNLNATDAVASQVAKVNSSLQASGIDPSKFAEILPATEEMPGLYIQMEALIAQASTNIGSATYTLGAPAVDKVSNLVQIPITVSGNGTYPNLKQFLSSFEQNIRPVSFTQISINVAQASQAGASSDQSSTTSEKAKGPVNITASGYIEALALSSAYAPDTSTP